LQFISAAKTRPFDIVIEDWFVGPGSRVVQAPPSDATLLAVILASVEKRWLVDVPPYSGHSLPDPGFCALVDAAARGRSARVPQDG
jgi:hypothetical protein